MPRIRWIGRPKTRLRPEQPCPQFGYNFLAIAARASGPGRQCIGPVPHETVRASIGRASPEPGCGRMPFRLRSASRGVLRRHRDRRIADQKVRRASDSRRHRDPGVAAEQVTIPGQRKVVRIRNHCDADVPAAAENIGRAGGDRSIGAMPGRSTRSALGRWSSLERREQNHRSCQASSRA